MCRMILRDRLAINPRQLCLRQFGKQVPSDLERGIDVPVFIPLMPHELAYQNTAIDLVSDLWVANTYDE